MVEKEIEIKMPEGVSDGFLFQPEAHGKWPGVIFLTDIVGIRASQYQEAQELCHAGFVVLMPNIFYRTGRPPVFEQPFDPKSEYTVKRLAELRASLPPVAMERDGIAYIDFLSQQESVGSKKFGVVGFCFAGAMALRMSAARPDKIGAVASFHGGGLFTDAPDSPHTVLSRVKARLYFGHAIEDRSMPKEAIEKFEQALAAWGGKFESETYDGAYHGWTTLDSPVYNKPQAERAFTKFTTMFKSALS